MMQMSGLFCFGACELLILIKLSPAAELDGSAGGMKGNKTKQKGKIKVI